MQVVISTKILAPLTKFLLSNSKLEVVIFVLESAVEVVRGAEILKRKPNSNQKSTCIFMNKHCIGTHDAAVMTNFLNYIPYALTFCWAPKTAFFHIVKRQQWWSPFSPDPEQGWRKSITKLVLARSFFCVWKVFFAFPRHTKTLLSGIRGKPKLIYFQEKMECIININMDIIYFVMDIIT